MKKNYLLILLLLIGVNLKAQNCNFTATISPGQSTVQFTPNSAFSPNLFSFAWDFGDGSTSTLFNPAHTYNTVLPVVACCTIIDLTTSVIACVSCDTILLHNTTNCAFTFTNQGLVYSFQTVGVTSAASVSWDFGDGHGGTGDPITHTYAGNGNYTVSYSAFDASQNIICSGTQQVTVGSSTGTCAFTYLMNPFHAATVDFTVNAGMTSSVTWDFGDNTIGTGATVSHTYLTSGTYTVTVTVVDVNGVTCSSTQTVSVGNTTNNCLFSFAPDPNNPNTIIFGGVPAYPTSTLAWDFGDGGVGTGLTITHNYPNAGTYTVCMYERDSLGATICHSCMTVTIGNTNTCAFVATANPNHPLTIDFQVNGGLATTVTWDFGDGSTDTGLAPSHTYAVNGVYFVCATFGAPGITLCTSCNYVTVGPAVGCAINSYLNPFHNNTYVFNITQQSSSSQVVWSFGDGTSGTGQSVNHTYTSNGTYNVCVTEYDAMQNTLCQSCITITVSGNTISNCQASFIASSYGFDAYFIDMSVSSSITVSYAWDFGDGSTSNVQFPQHTYAAQGVYTACLVVNSVNPTCSDTFCTAVVIDTTGGHNPSNGCNAFYAFVQLSPYQVTVVNLSSGTNLAFDWDFGDGSPHDNSAYPSHFYTTTGSYNLCLTVTDPNSTCTSSYCDTLSVDSLGNIYRMASPGFTINVISPAALTGVKEVSTQGTFRAYPNPVTSELHFSIITGSEKAKSFKLFTYQGSEVLSGIVNGLEGNINTENLSSGTYLLEITLTDGSRSHQSIIKN